MSQKIRFRCLPGLENYLPKPRLASGELPEWLRRMPVRVPSESLAGEQVRTVKHCPPFIDAMRSGILFPLLADIRIEAGELHWDSELPIDPANGSTRSPIGVHVPEQVHGMPGTSADNFVIKFNNFWTVALPPDCSMLFTHPLNQLDLPFRTFSGLVDCDRWVDGYVHFPAYWIDGSFEGVIKAGTAVAQAWIVRRETVDIDCGEMNADELARHSSLSDSLQIRPGLYRKLYRAAGSS